MIKVVFGLVLATLIVGCSGSVKGELKTYPVTGIVLYNEQPLDGAEVAFWAPKAARAATGMTNAKGEFSLSAPEGESKITVSKSPPAANAGAAPKNAMEQLQLEQKRNDDAKKKPKDRPKPLVPPRYSNVKETPLTETVKSKGPNKFDQLKLTD